MARHIAGLPAGSIKTVIPDIWDNQNEISPIEVDFKIPSHGERRAMLALIKYRRDPVSGQVITDLAASVDLQTKAVRDFVTGLRNYSVDTVGGRKQIDDGKLLAQFGEDELIAYCYPRIIEPKLLEEDIKKNLTSAQSSTPPVIPASKETVENASA